MKKAGYTNELDAEERRELKDSDFGIREAREYPISDAPHVWGAEVYFTYAPEEKKRELARRILLKAKQFGVAIKSENILKWAQK